MTPQVRPCDDAAQLQKYIDTYWRHGHVLAHDAALLKFTYGTPWVDRDRFPAGFSVLGLYDRARLVGFLGAIVAPYPRPQSYWLALWHVLPESKGGGLGGKLLQRMQEIAEERDGWIGTFGAGPEALPVYLKRGYCVRAARRWIYDPEASTPVSLAPVLHGAECEPNPQWLDHRYHRHPVYTYDVRPRAIFRTEDNAWGRVTHACWLAVEARTEAESVYRAESARATQSGRRYLMDAWAFDRPGPGWLPAPADLPSVFHPVEARGNVIYAVGRPFVVTRVHKGDCDQDRPNAAATTEARATAAGRG
jgi:GNAT superfamily N-acetyltransferase